MAANVALGRFASVNPRTNAQEHSSAQQNPRWNLQIKRQCVALAAALLQTSAIGAYSKMMLADGDASVRTCPVASQHEIDRVIARLNLPKPPFTVVDTAGETQENELADLRAALRSRHSESNEIERIVRAYARQRADLRQFKRDVDLGREAQRPAFNIAGELPAEFADYLRGAVALHCGDTNAARNSWTTLLARPESERRFKSVWAAYMLGRSWQNENAEKALTFFSFTRALAAQGFVDSIGLASESLGWQARAHLDRGEYERAFELYAAQHASGDASARGSLRITALQALRESPPVLQRLATNRLARAMITAELVCNPSDFWSSADPASWLAALKRAGDVDADLAEQLALANYAGDDLEMVHFWIKRVPRSSVAQWIRAKLLVRDGKVNEATKILASISGAFPLFESTNAPNAALSENLFMRSYWHLTAGRHLLGELGVLRLHRREYALALDAFLRGGFRYDAAYVAEQVLSVDELKSYVDAQWPEGVVNSIEDEEGPDDLRPTNIAEHIRYVLARRLVRNERRLDAMAYFPAQRLAVFQVLNGALALADDGSQANDLRASNYYTAAWIVRTNGMELMGTEGAPDYAISHGNFENGITINDREPFSTNSVTGASPEEVARVRAHAVVPATRWHYRAHAAALAYEAAKLWPNNDDRTALALCWAGRWAEVTSDADIFYKMLVRRCRRTELGRVADERRWFPWLDENSRVVTYTTKPPPEEIEEPTVADMTEAEDDSDETPGEVLGPLVDDK